MKKAECEAAIHHLFSVWAKEKHTSKDDMSDPSIYEFMNWVRNKGHGQYLEFKSVRGAFNDIETWFNKEFNLTSRN